MADLKLFLFMALFTKAQSQMNLRERIDFLTDFLQRDGRSSTIVSHIQLSKNEHVEMCKMLSADQKQFKIANEYDVSKDTDDVVHLIELHSKSVWELLSEAVNTKTIKSPSRWLLLVNDEENVGNSNAYEDFFKGGINTGFADLYIDVSTEVYVAFHRRNHVVLYGVYKIKPHLPLTWEELGVWTPAGFDRPAPAPPAVRRRNLQGADVVVVAVFLHNRTQEHMADYLHREKDTLTKIPYYMTIHLVEWLNGTKVLNKTTTWGYRQPDGKYDGVVREMQDGRADIAGSCMVPQKERLNYMNFVITPSQIEAMFVFKKPSLASVTNIYVLPFSIGVWLSIVVLIFISSFTLFFSYFREDSIKGHHNVSWFQKVSDGFFDTLCLVFQQGTATDPISIASEF